MMSILNGLIVGSVALMMTFGSAFAEPLATAADGDGDAGVLSEFEIPEMVQVRVKHGESLYDLAQMSQVSIEALENINGIDLNTPLKGGQRLVIPMTKAVQSDFKTARNSFADKRKNAYLNRRGGLVEVKPYRVKTGDSAWGIGKANGGLPVWILKAFNPTVDLNQISIGQTISVPVVGDTVAEEEEEGSPQGSLESPTDDEIGC